MSTAHIDLPSLIEQFHDEDTCRRFLEELRWPNGPECPRCGTDGHVTPIISRNTYRCNTCKYQFSVRAGTVLQDSKLPLWKWFLGTYMVVEAKKGISSNQLKRMLGVSYKTSWYLTHRVRWAMGLVVEEQLRGIVEADETFVGGKRRNYSLDEYGRRRRGREAGHQKAVVLGAIERSGRVRLRMAPNRGRMAIKSFLDEAVADEAVAVYTDEWGPYRTVVDDEDTVHETVNHSSEEWVRGDVHTNNIEGVWSLLKRSIIGSYHHVSTKHLQAYLEEIEFRFNNRHNPYIFRETLRTLVTADPLTYSALIAEDGS